MTILKILFTSYFLTWLLQIPGFALGVWLSFKIIKRDVYDYFWGLSRTLSLLIVGFIIFALSHFGSFANNNIFFFSLLLIINAIALFYCFKYKKLFKLILTRNKKIFIFEELIFLFFFAFLITFRSIKSDILDLEKFMDMGLVNSYLKSTHFPIDDMWLANTKVNYYTFGHFLCSLLVRLFLVPSGIGYNLCLAFIMASVGINTFSLALNLIIRNKKKLFLPTLLSFLTTLGGNSHAIFFFLKKGTFNGFWYPDSTRYIHNTIHEFPSYSFIVADLHAHFINLPFVFIFLIFFYYWFSNLINTKQHNYILSFIISFLLGIFIITNTWDFIIYAILLTITSLLIILKSKKILKTLTQFFIESLFILFFTFLTASLWIFNFTSISQGINLVKESSPVAQFLELWTIQLTFLFIAIIIIVRKKHIFQVNNSIFIIALIFTSIFLLILPEVIYFKDIYPDHPRANTMFKFTYQAFCLLQIIVIWVINQIWEEKKIKNKFLALILIILVSLTMIFSYFGYRDYYGFKKPTTLDGENWYQQQNYDDYQLIKFLQINESKRPNIVEAVGESYTQYSRIATFTGLPTVLGWTVHEWLWRGGFDIPSLRTQEVKTIYEQPLSLETKILLKKYKIKYLIVGEKEFTSYQINEENLKKLGKIVFNHMLTQKTNLKTTQPTSNEVKNSYQPHNYYIIEIIHDANF